MAQLTIKQNKFYVEFLRCGNATEAYRLAFNTERMKDKTITEAAHALTRHPVIAPMIAAAKQKLLDNVIFEARDVIREWMDIATADNNKLMQMRRINCRHCNGTNHAYQYKNAAEFALAVAGVMDLNVVRRKQRLPPTPLPTDEGGYGFRFNAAPHPNCPECMGEGIEDVWFADTNKLTGKERKLYAGLKRTKDGMEIKTRDQDAALANIAKALGIGVEKLPDPNKLAVLQLPSDPIEAARAYQAFMKG